MTDKARILCTGLAGLQAQAFGLVEAAGLAPELCTIQPQWPWGLLSPSLWPRARWAVGPVPYAAPLPAVVVGAGGAGARVAASLRRPGVAAIAVQHPRMDLNKFDLVFAARHDGIQGPNVIVTRTALHRVTPARLAAARAVWAPIFAPYARPLVALLLGGSNGRYRFDSATAHQLANQLAALLKSGQAGLIITPSRRTDQAVTAILRDTLAPLGAWIWDGTGDNPYFGMLACADAIIATADSVSMVSEAVATAAPVYLVRLPGNSARIGAFMDAMVADGRVKNFAGSLELWDTAPMDDTAMAGAELRRRLGL
jgi:mitochondrial fission protein ELM1